MTPDQMTAPGSIILTADEVESVIDAIDVAANDYAYRASYETARIDPFGEEDDEKVGRINERDAYTRKAAGLSQLADRLRERAGIGVDRP